MASGDASLKRRLGLGGALVIGLGSMIGAGVFVVFAPAAAAAGHTLLIGLVLAAVVAYLNAMASAQLATAYPTSGGTYVYGRERLGEWWGFTAGWGFVVGKTASAAAMALAFAAYVVPTPGLVQRLVAALAMLALGGVNVLGVHRTAWVTAVLVTLTLASLMLVILVGWPGTGQGLPSLACLVCVDNWYGTIQSAGLLFFAFAGYARIATLGEEVVDPRRTIPRAILLALAITVLVYAGIGIATLSALGPERLAASTAPLRDVMVAAGFGALAPVVQVGAALASLGALLTLMAGIARTVLAMGRNQDLPGWLATVHPRFSTPHHAELVLAGVIAVVALATDLRNAIGFSSLCVLVYYAIANAAAFTQVGATRLWPRELNVAGMLGCLLLAVTLPWQSVVTGVGVLGLGLLGRRLVRAA